MTARPILMSAPMIRALLDGRKTQTRRLVKPQPEHRQYHEHNGHVVYDGESRMWCWKDLVLDNIWDFPDGEDRRTLAARCPYGRPSDQLWVRETWASSRTPENHGFAREGYTYRADWDVFDDIDLRDFPWKPSIFMPREASRLTLELIEVRVERLQDISEADSRAEGVAPMGTGGWHTGTQGHMVGFNTARGAYQQIWESINGPGSWKANPWVWALTFNVHQRNIDSYLEEIAA